MAYKNREKLKKVSLNPDAKDDEIIIIQNQGISSQNRDPRVKPEDDIVVREFRISYRDPPRGLGDETKSKAQG